MTLAVPDFSALTLAQFAAIMVIVALLDFVTGVFAAIRAGTFNVDALPVIAQSHGLERIIPIAAVFAVGQIGAMPPICFIADGLLAFYFAETVNSVIGNLSAKAAPDPAPPAA